MVIVPTDRARAWDQQMTFYATSTLKGTSDEPEFQLHLNFTQKNKTKLTTVKAGLAYELGKDCAFIADYVQTGHQKDFEAGVHTHLDGEFYLGLGFIQLTGKGLTGSGSIFALEKEID